MAGVKRRSKYRKQVEDDALHGFPEPGEGELIVRVNCSRGGNLFEVVDPEGETALARMPTKFRRLIWIKRGQFIIVSGSAGDFTNAAGEVGKVKYSVEHVLSPRQVRQLIKVGKWPAAFADALRVESESVEGSEEGVSRPSAADATDDSGDEAAPAAADSAAASATVTDATVAAAAGPSDGVGMEDSGSESDSSHDDDLFENINRRPPMDSSDEDDD